MKIRKIAQIENIGVFKKHLNNNIEYQDINFIYANNASGKTTLVDIIKDLSEAKDERIKKRKTIPDSGAQFIRVVVKDNNISSSEQNIIYKNSAWSNNLLKGKVLVFDTSFIANNIFNGLELLASKDTKNNFSGFILGDSGVSLARERSSINEQLIEERKKLKLSIPESMKEETYCDKKIKEYCETKIIEPLKELETKKNELSGKIKAEKNLLENTELINNFQGIPSVKVDSINLYKTIIDVLKLILKETFEVKVENCKIYQSHLENHFPSEEVGRKWIEEGIEYTKEKDDCPFCGQSLSVSMLYPNYKLIFSREFSDFSKSIRNRVKSSLNELKKINLEFPITEVFSKIQSAKKLFGGSFIISDDFYVHLEKFDSWNKKNIKELNEERDQLFAALKTKNVLVNENIYFDFNKILDLLNELNDIYAVLNRDIKKMNEDIDGLKAKSVSKDVSVLDEYEKSLNNINQKIKRIEEDGDCNEWLESYIEIEKLKKLRDEKDHELETSQEEYLDKYFGDINNYFGKFGGYNYKIERGSTNKRYKEPVIGVNISFKDTNVSDIESSKLFSESDRRALALAIFIAKVKNISSKDLENTILVFDDPVTSFDTDRMTSVCKSIIELSDLVNQMFILSHQYNFSQKMFANFGGKKYLDGPKPPKYFQISKSGSGVSTISELDPVKLFNHEFIKQYDKISSFIKGNNDNLTGNDLRIFIEDYLTVSFPKLYCDVFSKRYYPLDEIITQLREKNYITQQVSVELKRFKDTLNPASHTPDHFTLEELRTYSKEILDYLDENFRID